MSRFRSSQAFAATSKRTSELKLRSRRAADRNDVRALETQQSGLHGETARKAGERAVRSDHAMARRDDRDRIAAVRGADGAHGRGMPDLIGDLRVAARLAERNREQRVPHLLLERGPDEIELEIEDLAPAREILRELALGGEQHRMPRVLGRSEEHTSE